MIRERARAVTAILVTSCLLTTTAPAALAADVSAPAGTLTIGNGTGWSKSRTVTVAVPATDDVGVTAMRLTWGDTVVDLPYAPTASFTVPYDEYWGVSITWFDAAGNSSTAGGIVVVDTEPPEINTFRPAEEDPDPTDGLFPFAVIGSDGWGLPTHVRLRTSGNPTWSPSYPLPEPDAWAPLILEWAALDPTKGGNPTLGTRTVVVSLRDPAGNWSNETRQVHIGFNNVDVLVTGDQRTGHAVTFRPDIPSGVVYPTGSICRWTLFWGNDASLYYGERDDTFGSVEFQGPLSGGYCKPWTVTIPWVPVRQFLVAFRAESADGEAVVDAELGGNGPDDPAFEPGEHGLSRHITSSTLPLVYVLPETYNLVVGEPATYRAYPIAGAKLRSTDVWSVNYIDTPERVTGARSSFTFIPKIVGHITVCWNGGASQTYWIHACYDPPSRRRDSTPPNTTTPVVQTARGAVTSGHGVRISWSGTDRGWGIATYRLERSVNGGAWARVSVDSSATSTVQSLAVGHAYRYRVRATDKAGNIGSWDYSATYDLRRRELTRG